MKVYSLPDESVTDVLAEALKKYHGELSKINIRIGIIMVSSEDKDGEPDGKPALKSASGHPAAAKVGLVSPKDRLTKHYEVEILIDSQAWGEMTPAKRLAVLDHELTHVEVTKGGEGEVKVDAYGNPKLKLIPDQFHLWGFLEIAQRHGTDSSEVLCMRDMVSQHGHLFGVAPGEEPVPKDELRPDAKI